MLPQVEPQPAVGADARCPPSLGGPGSTGQGREEERARTRVREHRRCAGRGDGPATTEGRPGNRAPGASWRRRRPVQGEVTATALCSAPGETLGLPEDPRPCPVLPSPGEEGAAEAGGGARSPALSTIS